MQNIELKTTPRKSPRPKEQGRREDVERRRAGALGARDVRFGRAGTVSFESLPSELRENSVRNHQNYARIFSEFIHSGIRQKSRNFKFDEISTFSTNLANFREKFIQVCAKFDENVIYLCSQISNAKRSQLLLRTLCRHLS